MKHRPPLAWIVLAGATGCHSCHEDHPYVPYSVGATTTLAPAGASGATVAAEPAEAAPPPEPFAGQPAVLAPPATSHWVVDGTTLDAPDGLVFVSALIGDFDHDGIPDAFALARPAEGNDPGEALFVRGSSGGSAAAVTFAPPPGLPRDPACTPVDRLLGVGPRSALVELGAQCAGHAWAGPARWLAILDSASATDAARVRLAATLADPEGAPALTVDAAVADRDGDGRDDLALRVTVEGGGPPLEPGPRVSATLAWLDRPAGLSRDAGATEGSFAALAASAGARALRPREAAEVPSYAAQVRALWRAACADGGSPRLVAVAGTGAISCGASHPLEDVGLAEVRAYATLGDPLRAALAFERNERPPASHTTARVAEAQKWIAQLATPAGARMLRAVAAVPAAPRGREPVWGALAFEPSGKLLVRTRAGVVRVDPDLGDEVAAGVPDWSTSVQSPDGSLRWIEAYDPCDGLPLRATFELASGDDSRDVALPIPPPLAGRCNGSRGATARAVPVGWGPRGLEALVEGELVLISPDLTNASVLAALVDQPPAPGSPRSPDGKTFVVPTSVGFLVRDAARARLLRASELDGTYGDQHDCAVSNDSTHVACVRGGRAWVGTWDS
jgi:hypothetical protein